MKTVTYRFTGESSWSDLSVVSLGNREYTACQEGRQNQDVDDRVVRINRQQAKGLTV